MLPSFAQVSDLVARLPQDVDASDEDRAQAVLDDASTVVRVEAGKSWTSGNALVSDIPDIVFVCTLRLALRAFLNPAGATQQGVDTFQVTWGPEDNYWREQLRKAAGLTGLTSLKLTSPMPRMAIPGPFTWYDNDTGDWVSWSDETGEGDGS